MDDKVKRYARYLLIMAGLGGLIYGIDVGVCAAAYPYIEKTSDFTKAQLGLIVGAVLWGSVVSSLFAGSLSEWFGRKIIIIVSALFFTLSIPVICASGLFEGGNFMQDMRGLGKRINYLLQEEPNPIMSASDLWKLVEINRLFFGNSFVYIERDEFGFPLHLWLVKSGGYNIVSGTYSTIVYLSDHDYVTLTNVPREDVLHFANTFRYQNGIWGIPTLQYAIETLSLNRTLRQQSLETAAKGGRVKLIIGEEKPAGTASTVVAYLYRGSKVKILEEKKIEAEAVVLSLGYKADQSLKAALEEKGIPVKLVGCTAKENDAAPVEEQRCEEGICEGKKKKYRFSCGHVLGQQKIVDQRSRLCPVPGRGYFRRSGSPPPEALSGLLPAGRKVPCRIGLRSCLHQL